MGSVEETTTCNRMELTGVLEALRTLREPCSVVVRTDSMITMNVCTMSGWRYKAGNKKKPPANWDLVQPVLELMLRHQVTFRWVRAHAGDPDNERCDVLACAARNRRIARMSGGLCELLEFTALEVN